MSPAAHLLRGAVLAYRYTLSAWLGQGCRFRPTCSEYALDAIALHGAAKGGWLALRRLGRCHPWGGSGWDPVPGSVCGPAMTEHHHHPRRDSGAGPAAARR